MEVDKEKKDALIQRIIGIERDLVQERRREDGSKTARRIEEIRFGLWRARKSLERLILDGDDPTKQ